MNLNSIIVRLFTSVSIYLFTLKGNEAGNSSRMEFFAFEKAFTFLLGTGLLIKSFISDLNCQVDEGRLSKKHDLETEIPNSV